MSDSSTARFGMTCQDSPKRSFSQPHRLSVPPSAMSASHSRSVSTGIRAVERKEGSAESR